MNNKTINAAVFTSVVLFALASFVTVGYPFFFRGSIAEASTQIDPKEGKVWLDTQITVEFRGSHSKEAILKTLKVSPRVNISEEDLLVYHIAAFPWHKGFPWAKTRVVINPNKAELFAPETYYTVLIRDKKLEFETITVPRVANTDPKEADENISVHDGIIEISFNEKIIWEDHLISVEPRLDLVIEQHSTKEKIFIRPKDWPWENETTYKLTIKKGLKDAFGHRMRENFTFSFTTEPPVRVVQVLPSDDTQRLDAVVRVFFGRAPLSRAAEGSFLIAPSVEGTLGWDGETTLVWTPTQNLSYSTEYFLTIGGESSWQDPITAYNWSFRTQDPPVFVDIQGGSDSPATLAAIASGGLGEYFYEWSTGETSRQITVKVPAGKTYTYLVTVFSGDQTAVAEANVKGPPLPPLPVVPSVPASPPIPVSGGGMKFVLSFDDSDGSGAIVSGILDILARYGAKAIFFPTGSWANGAGSSYVSRMLSEGHLVCNHTRDHANLTTLSESGIREQILGGAGVGQCNLLRPPYGAHNAFVDSVAASLGYSIYMWTVDPRDWSGTSVSYITNTILGGATPGGIAVLHMHAGNTLIALPGIIEGLRVAGYEVSY